MSSRFIMPFADVGSGIKPSSGAKLFFFEIDGVTPKDTFSDQLSTPTPNTNPVISDSNGVFSDIYIEGTYKVTLQDKNGSQIFGGALVDEVLTSAGDFTERLTLSEAKLKKVVVAGAVVRISDRADSLFEYKTGQSPDEFTIIASTGTPTLSLVLIEEDEVNIVSVGCVGDDLTDNSAALLAADALNVTLVIPKGIFRSETNITLNSHLMPKRDGILKPVASLIIINGPISAGGYKIFDLSLLTTESIVATASQTVFNLANPYVIGSGNLFVFYNDMLMSITTGYTETTTTSITTVAGIAVGVTLKFVVGGIQFGTARNDRIDVATGNVHPEYWGATGFDDLTHDDTPDVQAALDSGRPYKALRRYNVTQVNINESERHIDFSNFALMGTSTTLKSVLEIKCNASVLRDIRADCQFSLTYETAIHWYTNLLPGNVTGVFGFSPGNNRIFGIQGDSAQIALTIGALPSQSASAMPPQNSTSELPPTAINAPLSESHVFGLRSENCLTPLRMRQSNGKVTFTGSVASPNFGNFSTSLQTNAINIAGVDGGEILWHGGAIENVVDINGFMINMDNGNLTVDGAIVEALCTSFIAGEARVSFSKLGNFGLNSNIIPWFAVQAQHTGEINFSDFEIFMPANRFDAGTQPFIKTVTDTTLSFEPSPNLVVNMSNMQLQDVPWNDGGTQYMQPVLGGRINYSNCSIESINSAGTPRDILHRLDSGQNLLDGLVDTPATTVLTYPQTTGATSGGWVFTVSTSSNTFGSNTDTPTVELTPFSKAIRLTSIAGQEARATSPAIPASPSTSYIFDAWLKTGASGATVRIRMEFFKFDGTASSTVETNMFSGAESKLGTVYQPFSGIVKTPADAVSMKMVLIAEGGADLTFANPELN